MDKCQLISSSLRTRVLDAVSRLTSRNQVPVNVMSSLFDGGIDLKRGPSLEDMKQLLVDAFRTFDHSKTTAVDRLTETTRGHQRNPARLLDQHNRRTLRNNARPSTRHDMPTQALLQPHLN